jgi:hypothetical protein
LQGSMDDDGEYELLPRQEVDKLKKEIEKLKKNPLGELSENDSLIGAINDLNNNIKKLIDIFANTEAEIAKFYADNNPLDDLKAVKEQNEQIAQGLVAVADMLKNSNAPRDEMQRMQPSQQMPTTQQQPQMPSQQQQFSPQPQQQFNYQPSQQFPDFSSQPSSQQLQPPPFFDPQTIPPTPTEKKRGLFSRR